LPGETEFVDLGAVEGAVGEFANILAGVDAEELAGRGGCDGSDFDWSVLGDKKVVGLREFFHGERMPRREGEEEVRVVEAAEARRHARTIRRMGVKGKPERGFGKCGGIGHDGGYGLDQW
jgi:hypothetical protein